VVECRVSSGEPTRNTLQSAIRTLLSAILVFLHRTDVGVAHLASSRPTYLAFVCGAGVRAPSVEKGPDTTLSCRAEEEEAVTFAIQTSYASVRTE